MGFKYAYFISNLFFLAVWLLIFWKVKHLRRPMLIMSLITASFGSISEIWYFADYWKPAIGSSYLISMINMRFLLISAPLIQYV